MRNTFLSLLLILAMLCSLSGSSCNRTDPCACATMEEAPQAFLDYWYFPTGSWWVYALKDSVGVYDTVTVTARYVEDIDYCKDPLRDDAPCAKAYEVDQSHSNTIYFKHPQNKPFTNLSSTIFGKYWNLDYYPITSNLDYNQIFFQYPFEIGSSFIHNTGNPVSIDTILSVSSQSIVAAHIQLTISPAADSVNGREWLKEVWFAPGIGMVKTRYTFNRVWELVDYYIAE